jgi:hypothetical protein
MSRYPLALGLIGYEPGTSSAVRRQKRIALTGAAGVGGYAVLEIFEIAGSSVPDAANLAALESVARAQRPGVLLVHGHVDTRTVRGLAARVDLNVVSIDVNEQAR